MSGYDAPPASRSSMAPAGDGDRLAARVGGRALFLVRSLHYGGAERQLVELVRELHARGRDVVVMVFYGGGPLEAELRSSGVRVVSLGKHGRWDIPRFLSALVARIREERPVVIHSYMDIANIVAALARPFCRKVRIVWGFRASDMQLGRYGWMWRAAFRLERLLSRVPERIIVNSQAGVEHRVRSGFSRERMLHIPNGVDVDRFRPDSGAGERFRHEWAIAPDRMLIGLVARLDPMKGHEVFLEAAVSLLGVREDLHFVCVGDGPAEYRERLLGTRAARALGERLTWVPARAEVAAVYNALDLLCLSSSYGEGFPNVIGEAMACGVPCVATDVGDAAAIIGDARRVVPRNDPERLALALASALPEARDASARARVRRRIVENFSTAALAERTEEALWPTD
jgi:glycosyltransferase involved in cell wall biosynthesis